MVKKPSDQEYLMFDGGNCCILWDELNEEWRCPSCNRTKREVMKWERRKGKSNKPYGWSCQLHRHHDHSGYKRFEETIICGQCNAADGNVKRYWDLPSEFSFSPEEIKFFVTSIPHEKHIIDFKEAKRIYDSNYSSKYKL